MNVRTHFNYFLSIWEGKGANEEYYHKIYSSHLSACLSIYDGRFLFFLYNNNMINGLQFPGGWKLHHMIICVSHYLSQWHAYVNVVDLEK